MSDNYEFEKAMQSQATDDYSPYVDKQSNGYINDINNGVYTNNSLTLVNFDLGQIYNSQKLLIQMIYSWFYQSQWSLLSVMFLLILKPLFLVEVIYVLLRLIL